MKYTIKDLAEGKCALINDGTYEEVQKVLKAAYPLTNKIYGKYGTKYYWTANGAYWYNLNKQPFLPMQSVKDFLKEEWEPKWGEEIRSINNPGFRGTFVAVHPTKSDSYIYINHGLSDALQYCDKKYIIPVPKEIEVTIDEIAKWKGVDASLIRIK